MFNGYARTERECRCLRFAICHRLTSAVCVCVTNFVKPHRKLLQEFAVIHMAESSGNVMLPETVFIAVTPRGVTNLAHLEAG
jgi:hypothetical protein